MRRRMLPIAFFIFLLLLHEKRNDAMSLLWSSPRQKIRLQLAPLIGGPSWLPVHVKVLIGIDDDEEEEEEEENRLDGSSLSSPPQPNFVCDFVPLDPASKETIQKLLTLQGVPAEARFVVVNNRTSTNNTVGDALTETTEIDNDTAGEQAKVGELAKHFCEAYPKDLHLIKNNCWTFAYKLIRHVQENQNTRTTRK